MSKSETKFFYLLSTNYNYKKRHMQNHAAKCLRFGMACFIAKYTALILDTSCIQHFLPKEYSIRAYSSIPKTEQYISRFLYSIAKQTCTAVVPATTCPYIFSESADNSSPCVCAVFLPPLAGRAWQVPLSCYESPQKSGSAFSPQYSAYSNNSG